jgi:hypothetical protein
MPIQVSFDISDFEAEQPEDEEEVEGVLFLSV